MHQEPDSRRLNEKSIAVVWDKGPKQVKIIASSGRLSRSEFASEGSAPLRVEVTVSEAVLAAGAQATCITVSGDDTCFSFFLRDVSCEWPVLLPYYKVAVTTVDDDRSYRDMAEALESRKLVSNWQRIENGEEQSYEAACRENRDQICPAWLGLSRDMRMFAVEHQEQYGFWGYIKPRYHSTAVKFKELNDYESNIFFMVGPGESCRVKLTRRLEEGCLPILRSEQIEEGVRYNLTAFATSETEPLNSRPLRGTPWQAGYPSAHGHMLSPEELADCQDVIRAETEGREDTVVCCVRVTAVNTSGAPRYAWFKGASLTTHCYQEKRFAGAAAYDSSHGWGTVGDRVYAINRFEGGAMPQPEMAVLLKPGQSVTWEILVPHAPISQDRAVRLANINLHEHLESCREFWRQKHAAGARIFLPEEGIEHRIRAGLTHCDINSIGREPDQPVMATIGWYAPIGSESAPIIQFFDSMGWHQLAERALDFFLIRQRRDGFIQNYKGYQLETGPVLWTMGEHYRYTRDDDWVARVEDNILRASDYLLKWRDNNKREELRGKGYGLIDGKVADPDDFFHSFMLNALSYTGIQRAGEMLAKVNPEESQRLLEEAVAYREDIRTAFFECLGRGPAVPLGDGTWCPTVGPWTEYTGPLALYADGGSWSTHGTFGARDSMIGALYLVIGEVLDPDEPGAEMLLRFHQELFTVKNAAFSQPYYTRHDFTHIRRNEVKLFLKAYYNQMTALQDRGNYAFWEHYHHASENKTHEEGWFLMQTRWMLYLEQDCELHFLKAIPRRWLEDGESITLNQVATYFGKFTLAVTSRLLTDGTVTAEISADKDRLPDAVTVRLPHPEGARPRRCEGGSYDEDTETVRIDNFQGQAVVILSF